MRYWIILGEEHISEQIGIINSSNNFNVIECLYGILYFVVSVILNFQWVSFVQACVDRRKIHIDNERTHENSVRVCITFPTYFLSCGLYLYCHIGSMTTDFFLRCAHVTYESMWHFRWNSKIFEAHDWRSAAPVYSRNQFDRSKSELAGIHKFWIVYHLALIVSQLSPKIRIRSKPPFPFNSLTYYTYK